MKYLAIIVFYLAQMMISQAADVRVVGIPEQQRKRIFAKMSPRLEFINARPASDWRADDAAFFMQRILIREGYADSKTDWSLPGNDVILLKVDLGYKYTFGEVYHNISGSEDDELLDDYFFQPLIEGEMVARKSAPYLESYPDTGVKNVENHLKSLGYWKAQVNLVKQVKRSTEPKVDIYLNIVKGPMHKLATPQIIGVDSNTRGLLLSEMRSLIGEQSSYANITELRRIVTQYFSKQGYEFAEINVSADHVGGYTRIDFNIDAGLRYQVRKITVEGNEKTERRRFNRYLDSMRGKYYDAEKVAKIESELLRTGAFESVKVTPKPVGGDQLDLQVEVQEMRAKYVRTYAGFASFDGLILGTSYTDQNFLGKLQRFGARAEISRRGLLGEVSLTEPFFAGEPIRQTTKLYALRRKYDSYNIGESGLELAFKWQPNENYSTRLFTGASLSMADSNNISAIELGPETYVNTNIGIEQEIDFRDNPVVPTTGFHARGLLEFGSINGDAFSNYLRSELNTSYRYKFKNNNRLEFRYSMGAIFPTDSDDLPIDLRYFRGGVDSVRSFGDRDLGPQSINGESIGGEAYWEASVEYIRPFNDLIAGVAFLDTGQVFEKTTDFGYDDPSHAIGLGVRIDLPIGPVRFEYGYNLNRKQGDPTGAFHFSIGAKF